MGNKIKEKRLNANMSQKELAAASGVTRQTISQLENGKKENVSTKTLIKIANALGTTIDYIFFADNV